MKFGGPDALVDALKILADRESGQESITQEAHRLVTGNRGADYGHPFEDFGRTAGMISALLSHKLKEPITQEDVAALMICVKLSRTTNKPSRDSCVDLAGYAQCLWMCIEARQSHDAKCSYGEVSP